MSSKKHRRKIKAFYEGQPLKKTTTKKKIADKPSIKQEINSMLGKIRDFSVIFPEIDSKPIKLGKLFEVSIKIGNDKIQEKRLIYATIVIPEEESKGCVDGLINLLATQNNKVITAPAINNEAVVSPVLKVIYPFPVGGFAMTPIAIFNWHGKEKITISEIKECSPKISTLVNTPYYYIEDMVWGGFYLGRQIDGAEIFDEAIAL